MQLKKAGPASILILTGKPAELFSFPMVQCEQAQISPLSHTTSTARLKDQQEEGWAWKKNPAASARPCALIKWLKVFWALCKQKEKNGCLHLWVCHVLRLEAHDASTFSWNKVHKCCPKVLRKHFTFWFWSSQELKWAGNYTAWLQHVTKKCMCEWLATWFIIALLNPEVMNL